MFVLQKLQDFEANRKAIIHTHAVRVSGKPRGIPLVTAAKWKSAGGEGLNSSPEIPLKSENETPARTTSCAVGVKGLDKRGKLKQKGGGGGVFWGGVGIPISKEETTSVLGKPRKLVVVGSRCP